MVGFVLFLVSVLVSFISPFLCVGIRSGVGVRVRVGIRVRVC